MHIRPIPKRILNQKATYIPCLRDTRDGKAWGEEIELSNIALSHSSKYSVSGGSQYIRHNAVLFYDCNYSLPKNMDFTEQGMIILNGKKMVIERVVTPNTLSGKPHHYELELFESVNGRQ